MSALSILQVIISDDFKTFLNFASELTKQLLTISVALITFSVAFIKDIIKDFPPKKAWIVGVAWGSIFLSILSGILHLMALTGIIERALSSKASPVVESNAKLFAGLQLFFFLMGILFIVIYGLISVRTKKQSSVTGVTEFI